MPEYARLTVLTDPCLKKAFDELCSEQDSTTSQVLRRLIAEFLRAHGVTWQPAGAREARGRR